MQRESINSWYTLNRANTTVNLERAWKKDQDTAPVIPKLAVNVPNQIGNQAVVDARSQFSDDAAHIRISHKVFFIRAISQWHRVSDHCDNIVKIIVLNGKGAPFDVNMSDLVCATEIIRKDVHVKSRAHKDDFKIFSNFQGISK